MIWLRRLGMYAVLALFVAGTYWGLSLVPQASTTDGDATIVRAPLKRVDVLTLKPQAFTETILVPGTVEAREDIVLSAAISGLVESVAIEEGQRVQKGDVLAQIDLRTRQTLYDEAKVTLDLAQKNLDRMTTLRERDDVTAQDYDRAVSEHQQAVHAVNRARVERSLGIITAPIDGVIDRVDVEEGEYATEGMPLARLLDIDTVEVLAGIPERFAGLVQDGEETEVEFEALRDVQRGVVERVALAANQMTNTFEARIVLDNPDTLIRPGMIARTRLVTRYVPEALLVPLLALVKRETGMVVFIETDGLVEERPVELGAVQGAEVEVMSGVHAGANLVVIGQQDLVHGQEVEVMKRLDSMENTEPLLEVR